MGKSFLKKRRNDTIFILVWFLLKLVYAIPRHWGLLVFKYIGRFAYYLPIAERQFIQTNVATVIGQSWSTIRIKTFCMSVYEQLGQNIFDGLYLNRCTDKQFFSIVSHDSMDEIFKAYHQKQGVICVASHQGCFEMLIQTIARRKIECFTVGQRLFDHRIDALISHMRQSHGVTYLHRDGSGRKIIRLLKKGLFFGVLIDQDTNIEGYFAHFLGKLAYTPVGPLRIALQLNIPLFCAYTARQPNNTHHVYFQGPLHITRTADMTRDCVTTLETVNSYLSNGIERFPDQWVWMHRRWDKKPHDKRYAHIPTIESYAKQHTQSSCQ